MTGFGAPWTSLVACLAVAVVLLASVQLKLADYPSFVAWARSARNPFVRRLVEHAVIPAELATVLLLVIAGSGDVGVLAATVAASIAALAALASKQLMGDQRCACFGRASMAGLVSGIRVFGLLALASATLFLLTFVPAVSGNLPVALALLAWLAAPIASSRLAAKLHSRSYVVVDGARQAITPEFRDMLARHAQSGDPDRPCVILFTLKGCPPCREIAAPFEAFARAFPHNARFFVFERGGVREERVGDGAVHLSAADPDLPKSIGVSMYPAVLVLEQGPASLDARPYLNTDDIRSLLGSFIRPPPVDVAAQRDAIHPEPGRVARTPTPSAEPERATLES